MKLLYTILLLLMLPQLSFKDTQLKHIRVKFAYTEKENTVKNYFSHKNLIYPGTHIFLRAFKKEMKLEVWAQSKAQEKYSLLTTYNFCATSGTLGPKRKEGDRQIPEGVYFINHFNPLSNFHLSLGLNYPNRADQILGDKHPGSAIYIHGSCVTIGCIPLSDDKIKELYILCVEAINNGQQKIPVHIFPSRMDKENLDLLSNAYGEKPELIAFWKNLQRIYNDFDANHKLTVVKINAKGEYCFNLP